ncbi:MAG: B12-binding domain-containing radical SAM protein, partial [Phycisphaerae bacterium]|nr:B12-binding domain-containing radical SAM protein [Saprospiraceae bacterium]
MPKIGFIAISGVRCNDEELLALGLNLPGFVERSQVIASLPSLGLLTLAGMTRDFNEGQAAQNVYEMSYVEVPELKDFDDSLHQFDLVAISSFSAKIKDAYTLAQRFRARETFVIMGGLHVSTQSPEALEFADSVILGEAEIHWHQFLADFVANQTKPVYDCRGTSFDLANATMPAFELLDISRYNRLTVQTQRGCPWKCGFCASTILLNPLFRNKPVEKVVAEIKRIKEIWPKPFIEFADDNTFVDKEYGKELMRALIPLEIKWFTETDISVADDDELLALMKRSGCAQILIGLESPRKEILFAVNNWKQSRYDTYIENIQRIQSYGITVNGCFILGLEHTDHNYFEQVFQFIREANLFEVQITVMTAFPGTPLYDSLLKQNRLIEPKAWERCTLFDINFLPNNMTVKELRDGMIDLGKRVY